MNKNIKIHESWLKYIEAEFDKEYMRNVKESILNFKESGKIIYPKNNEIFNAINLTEFDKTKVIILGQDPYHGPGQAHGLSFSVPVGIKVPPSLKNIFKEQADDLGLAVPQSGNLEKWAREGVLLLNNVLTVERSRANSHKKLGWEKFTKATIEAISSNLENIVFSLWGRDAQSKEKLIDASKHLILKTVHPSPLSAYNGFFGCKHFSKTNSYLEMNNIEKIKWDLS